MPLVWPKEAGKTNVSAKRDFLHLDFPRRPTRAPVICKRKTWQRSPAPFFSRCGSKCHHRPPPPSSYSNKPVLIRQPFFFGRVKIKRSLENVRSEISQSKEKVTHISWLIALTHIFQMPGLFCNQANRPASLCVGLPQPKPPGDLPSETAPCKLEGPGQAAKAAWGAPSLW